MNNSLFVEKKYGFDLEATKLLKELKESFDIEKISGLRILNCYDIFGISEKELEKSKKLIFSEVTTDKIVEKASFEKNKHFAVEYLPGQFDQRADSAMQCLNILSTKNKNVKITSGKVIVFEGEISKEEIEKIKKYYINPVEMREKNLELIKIESTGKSPKVKTIIGFINYSEKQLKEFREKMSLAMTDKDLIFVQEYFKNKEKRNPTETEIRVLDTYWSDHCRHTTFTTKITDIDLPIVKENGDFTDIINKVFRDYEKLRASVHGKNKKDITLMDMATIVAKDLRKNGLLKDLEVSEEINACSIHIDVKVDGKNKKYLLMFKNETHNHPTEIEPFGGASTCLGGAIRDPLSGRSYVYQAIRVTGSGNPLEKIEDTLEGKLPQKKITTGAASGYSSYGNQIGLTTCLVSEIYDEGYKAKRMEVGAVVGASPKEYVKRETPKPGDIVILIGGKTGRDGCGGATGSSKAHTDKSLRLCGAEVQKGNAPEERKLQRLFRNPKVTKIIKKCNDFGAGGVSVAIGELAEGLDINLDKVPVKYLGLSATELAISESQERMAVVVSKENVKKFIEYANEENIEATAVAKVTSNKRLVMKYKGEKIVNISRDFLDTNGVKEETKAKINEVNFNNTPFINYINKIRADLPVKEKLFISLQDLNIASQKGLSEIFDSSIGSSTVLMPFGGKYQTTPIDVSVQKIPVLKGETDTASAITWGYNPNIMKWSEFHGGIYSVIESIAKLVSIGSDYKNIRLSFQEYFQKLEKDPVKWGKVCSALLGSIYAQNAFKTPAIGGKDSMSGTFNKINVPSTLISFAVSIVEAKDVISPEFKKIKNKVYLIKHNMLKNYMPNIDELKKTFSFLYKNIKSKKIVSASLIKDGGLLTSLSKMTFGNKIGIKIDNLYNNDLFNLYPFSFIIETKEELKSEIKNIENIKLIGETIDEYKIIIDTSKEANKIKEIIDMEEAEKLWLNKLSPVFKYKTDENIETYPLTLYKRKEVFICRGKKVKPNVLIAAFPGTNCEYDTSKTFNNAGAKSDIIVFRNIKSEYIEESINTMAKKIDNSQIFVIPGGFSAADEPDGSGKFIAAVLMNEKIKNALYSLLKRDGLILGICNGFQALVKSGLLPYGEIGNINEYSPTLTFNKIGRHISQMVRTKIVSNNSPWLFNMEVGKEYIVPVSHGEGRFFANDETIKTLFENGQVATQYVNLEGNPTNEFSYNPNGSAYAIEGIFSKDGKVFGKMGHAERIGKNLYKNIPNAIEENIFKCGVKYFK